MSVPIFKIFLLKWLLKGVYIPFRAVLTYLDQYMDSIYLGG